MGMPRQELANVWPNSLVFILVIPRTFPESFIKIWWTKFKIPLKTVYFGTKNGLIWAKWWACPGKNGRTCDQTHQSSFFSYQEHFLKVSSKYDEPNSRYVVKRSFWTRLAKLPRPLLPFLSFFSRTGILWYMRFSRDVR